MRHNPLVKHLPYVLASAGAFAICAHLALPFSNPWHIVGGPSQAQFNPASNVLRFLIFVFAPVLLLLSLRILPFTRNLCPWGETSNGPRSFTYQQTALKPVLLLTIVSCLFCVIMALNSSTYHDSDPTLDTLHEGESLGASVTLLNGGIPYKDIVFSHGVFMDPLRSVVAFKLFTRSIGAARTLDSILTLLTFIVLFLFLLVLYEGRLLWVNLTLLVLLVSLSFRGLFILSRDLPTFGFLLVTAILLHAVREPGPRLSSVRCAALALFSFLPFAAMIYSVDRGFYLIATYCMLFPMIVFYFRGRSLYGSLLLSALGIGFAGLVAGIVLHWEFRPFFEYSIVNVPHYWELMDGFVYPFQSPRFLLIVLIISWNVYWVFARFLTAFLQGSKTTHQQGGFATFIRMNLMDICLLLMSFFFFRSALGRSDWEHVRYSSGIVYILACYLVIQYLLREALETHPKTSRIVERAVACIVVAACLGGGYRIAREHLLARDFPVKEVDDRFVPSDYQQAASFLKAHLSNGEEFLTLTSEPAWYYLLNQPCPTRFPVVWYGEPPFYQREIVRDISARRVKLILYSDGSGFSDLDGISARERLPIVYAYIRANYRPYATVAGMEFWIRKE